MSAWRPEIDTVRAVAVAAVVLAHATAGGSDAFPPGTGLQALYHVFHHLSAFAVPVLVWVCAVVWTVRYREGRGKPMPFYGDMLRSLAAPAAAAWGIYLLADRAGTNIGFEALAPIAALLQLALVFPFAFILCKNRERAVRIFLAAAWAVQIGFWAYQAWSDPIPYRNAIAPTYVGLFATGLWVGLRYEAAVERLNRHAGRISAVCAVSAAVYVLSVWRAQPGAGTFLPLPPAATEAVFQLYGLFAGLELLRSAKNMTEQSAFWRRVTVPLGIGWLGIYLIHPVFLAFWESIVPETIHPAAHLARTAGGAIAAAAATLGVVFTYRGRLRPRLPFVPNDSGEVGRPAAG